MNEKIVPANNGYTVQVGTTTLHSRYDPVSEAQKYISSLNLKPYVYFILIEPGLGYLAGALKNLFPSSKIISLHCSLFFQKQGSLICNEELSWDSSNALSLEYFLEELLGYTEASDIKLIEWKPSINIYGQACLDLAARTVECIRRISAGQKTVQNFGRRWLRNALHNLEFNRCDPCAERFEIHPGTSPVLVCAAGPSLEDSFKEITQWKQSSSPPLIIAVSSSAFALMHQGIIPDIIITSDGGSWALFHLIECYRQHTGLIFTQQKLKPFLAAALTSALPSQLKEWPVFFLWDGSLWQKLLLEAANMTDKTTIPAFPQRGTVSICALDLAFYASSGPVYVSGMDFLHKDILTHARPYAFEALMECSADRRRPRYSQAFEREETISRCGSLSIYKTWLDSHGNAFPRSFNYLQAGHKAPDINTNMPDNTFPHFTVKNIEKGKTDKKGLIAALLFALNNPLLKEQLSKELGELLLPSNMINDKQYADTVREALLEL